MINKHNSIFVSSYKIGIERLVYLKNFTQNSNLTEDETYVFRNDEYIKYQNNYSKKIYYSKKILELDNNEKEESSCVLNNDIIIENSELRKNIKNITSLKELKKECLKHKYILVEQELKSIFEDDFGYVTCNKYSETKEGKRWFQIHSIRHPVSELEKLKALAIFKKNYSYNKEFLSYIETNFDQKTPKELYEMFFEEVPILNVVELNSDFYDAFYINVNLKERMMFDPEVFHCLDTDSQNQSIYVGRQENSTVQNQIIYNPKFLGYPEFPSPTVEVVFFPKDVNMKSNKFKSTLDSTIENKSMQKTIFNQNKLDSINLQDQYKVSFSFDNSRDNFEVNCDGYYDLINLYNNDLIKIYESHFNLFSNQGNFYKNYKKFLNELLYKICIKKEQIEFADKFKIDSDFFQLLNKTNQILAVFDQFLAKKHIKNIKKDAFLNKIRWDFYSLESNIAIDIATSKDNLDKHDFKKNWCLAKEYWVITEEEEVFI
ncbi:hypothetical protein [Alphaproteobacteria bacterium endosymbiont of Tiliacea citrago]|uniref:hypothetical protein n=1 Tax=Alphaproteobacteria bacterium endosymbiont of Tiliacea citrago TaxID=3077944 RepID=UPI00313D21FC